MSKRTGILVAGAIVVVATLIFLIQNRSNADDKSLLMSQMQIGDVSLFSSPSDVSSLFVNGLMKIETNNSSTIYTAEEIVDGGQEEWIFSFTADRWLTKMMLSTPGSIETWGETVALYDSILTIERNVVSNWLSTPEQSELPLFTAGWETIGVLRTTRLKCVFSPEVDKLMISLEDVK